MEKYYAIRISIPINIANIGRTRESIVAYVKTEGEIKEGLQVYSSGSCPAPRLSIDRIEITEIKKEFYEAQRRNLEKRTDDLFTRLSKKGGVGGGVSG